jgi:hypothetical protein
VPNPCDVLVFVKGVGFDAHGSVCLIVTLSFGQEHALNPWPAIPEKERKKQQDRDSRKNERDAQLIVVSQIIIWLRNY